MVPEQRELFTTGLLEWSENNLRSFWWRDPDISMYRMFITEFFLARTKSGVVEEVLPRFFERFPDLDLIEQADEADIAEVIRPMGLQNRRARALKEIAETLDGEIPEDLDALLELPRVGPYVANATLCFGADRQLPIVDRNVDRVYRRVFQEEWEDVSDTEQWEFAEEMLPEGVARPYNLALLDFASDVCVASSPQCERCFATGYCTWYNSGQAGDT